MRTPNEIAKRALRLIDAATASTTNCRALNRLEDIQLYWDDEDPYAEPGYTAKNNVVAVGNWNGIDGEYNSETRKHTYVDDTPKRLGDALEALGIELEWSDEWTACCDCNRLVRISGDSYSWQRAYYESDNGAVCHECVKADPAEYLEALEGSDRSCETIGIDLTEHGYTLLEDRFEHGFHPGQDADPKAIAKSLRERGVTRFIFKLDCVQQFDMDFSVYVHESEIEQVQNWAQAKKTSDLSPAEGLRRALSGASALPLQGSQPDGSIVVTKIDVSTGTATTKLVSPQDFIDGKALD